MQTDREAEVLIIGAGVAGLSAAIYTARANKKTLVLRGKAGSRLGMAHLVENYPGIPSIKGSALLEIMEQQARGFGAEVVDTDAIDLGLGYSPKMINTRHGMIMAKAVIIATGKGNSEAQIKNESAFVGYGVSYCAICDGAFYKNKPVVVYGNDLEAVEDALSLAELGCRTTLCYKGPAASIEATLLDTLIEHNVQLIELATVKEIVGEKVVQSIKYQQGNDLIELACDAVFIIEHAPGPDLLAKAGLDLDPKQFVRVNEKQETNLPGVYAAGDVLGVGMQVATAAGAGVNAALSALKFLKG